MTTRETWRVVLAGGRVRNVVVTETQAGPEFIASCGAWSSRRAELAATPRGAIGALLWVTDWPVREILAPGEMTAAERMAVVTAERDDARMMSQCNRDNWRLAGEQRDALARAVAEYQSEREHVAAERARCAAVCREVAAQTPVDGIVEAAANACADAIEHGAVPRG